MPYRRIIAAFCIIFFCAIILCLNMPAFSQFLPWSWPPASPFPGIGQFPLFNYPQPSFFPTAGPYQTSGWPLYSPPPSFTAQPPPTQAPVAGACSNGLVLDVPIDTDFGPGASQITRCLIMNYGIKILFHINQFESRPGRAYGLSNIFAAVNDYEITNSTKDYKIVAVVHSGGSTLVLNRNAPTPHPNAINNIYQPDVEALIAKGVKFYL